MQFNYQARTEEGQLRKGKVEASSKEAALDLLQKHGFYVSYLEESGRKPFFAKDIEIFQRITKKDIVNFSRQLSLMFKANISLVEALNTLSGQLENPILREKLVQISEDVESGRNLSDSMAEYPDIFSPFYIWMIKAGEASGKLSEALTYLAEHQEREYKFINKIKEALTYPALLFTLVVAVIGLVIFFIIPKITTVLDVTNQSLPASTKIVMSLPSFLKTWGWIIFVVLFGFFILTYKYYQTEEGRLKFDTYLLDTPLIGDFVKKIYLARFADNFTTLASAGLPITKCLEIISNIIRNERYKEVIAKAKKGVTRGRSISSILTQYPEYFPPIFIQMLVVGEKTGSLNSSLKHVSNFYREEVDRGVENLITLLEPAMIILLGFVVGGIMISVLMPMYQIFSL